MTTALAKQIAIRMKAKNMSTLSLERQAGLKVNAVQNILRGLSKKPNAQTLQAVAEILGCTVEDLLNKERFFLQDDETFASKDTVLHSPYKQGPLLEACVALVNAKAAELDQKLSVQQIFTCVQELYLHSLATGTGSPDQDFADFFINMMTADQKGRGSSLSSK